MPRTNGFETSVTRLLGCNHPILLGARQVLDNPDDLAAATLSGAFCFFDLEKPETHPERGHDQSRHAVNPVRCPIGFRIPDEISAEDALQVTIPLGATAVLCSFGMCIAHGALFRQAGLVMVCEVSTVPEAIEAQASGADMLILRSGRDRPGTEQLVRAIQAVSDITLVLDAVALDGARLVQALACGTAGIYCEPWNEEGNPESPAHEMANDGNAQAPIGTGSSTGIGLRGATISDQVCRAVDGARVACDRLLGALRTDADRSSLGRVSLSGSLDPVHYAKLRDEDLVAALARLLKLQLEGARTCAIGYQDFMEPVERGIVRTLARNETSWVHQLAGRLAELTSGTVGTMCSDMDMAAGVSEVGLHPAQRLSETVRQTITLLELIVPLTRNTHVGSDLQKMLLQQREVQPSVEALASGHDGGGVVRMAPGSRTRVS